jgi:hypothetical protein
VNETWGASDLGRGNLNGVGYTGFEVVGGCNWVTREGGGGAWLRPKITSKPPGLDLANETCRGSDLGSRDLVGVGNTWF